MQALGIAWQGSAHIVQDEAVTVNVGLGDNVRFEACAGCPRILNAQLTGKKIHICKLAWAGPPLRSFLRWKLSPAC